MEMPEQGTLENPALSCFDLSLLRNIKASEPVSTGDMLTGWPNHSIFPPHTDSTYYVDPNGGSPRDAIEVTCREMERAKSWFTCIKPAFADEVSRKAEKKSGHAKFFCSVTWSHLLDDLWGRMQEESSRNQESGCLQGEYHKKPPMFHWVCIFFCGQLQQEPQPFAYGVEGTAQYQLRALAALSYTATQSITVSCNRFSQPIRMLGQDGQEISVRDYSWNMNYELAADKRCQVRWGNHPGHM